MNDGFSPAKPINLGPPSLRRLSKWSLEEERQWVIHIRRSLEQLDNNEEDETQLHPVSIFNVPKALISINPDLYTPQQVAIGPYHCWRPELYEMERHKLGAAKRIQKHLKLQDVVHKLDTLEHHIRASYHNYLDFTPETLTWIMAVDASFLLDFLHIYAPITQGKTRVSLGKSSHNAILRDIMMLENQIPLFVVKNILEFQLGSTESADELLFSMLLGLCTHLSPFKIPKELPKSELLSHSSHLLDFLYRIVVPKSQSTEINESAEEEEEPSSSSSANKNNSHHHHHLLNKLLLLGSRSIKFLSNLPWIIICNFPGISVLKQHIGYVFFSEETKENPNSNNQESSSAADKPPLMEEIAIPSVTELSEIGVRFQEGDSSNLSCIDFDPKNGVFTLPAISLDMNSEVILRNIVAYEAASGCGPLIFTRYTELMNGIIDTEEDVKALRDGGLIVNRLKSDAEVAHLWNGMSKSIRLTKVPFLDKVIQDVNQYYHGRWKVKIANLFNIYVFGSWQLLTFLAALMLLFLMTLQAFCTIYSCVPALPRKTTP